MLSLDADSEGVAWIPCTQIASPSSLQGKEPWLSLTHGNGIWLIIAGERGNRLVAKESQG